MRRSQRTSCPHFAAAFCGTIVEHVSNAFRVFVPTMFLYMDVGTV